MLDRHSCAWAGLIVRLNGFVLLRDDWDGRGSDAPALSVVYTAIALGRLLRDEAIVAPCRVSAGAFGSVHFEWYGFGCSLAITVLRADEVEVVSYSNLGCFTSEIFRWGTRPVEEVLAIVRPLTGHLGLNRSGVFAV